MSRKRADKIIEKVVVGPFVAPIRMSTDGVFSCEVGETSTSGPLIEVRRWARQTLLERSDLKWQPVMEVSFDAVDTMVNNLKNCSNLACTMERHWLAWAGKYWIICPWVVQRPGTIVCSPHAVSEIEQPSMSKEELAAQRLYHSRRFNVTDAPVIQWPQISSWMSDKVYWVPYSEESWQTMLGILERMRELRATLNKMLSTQTGWTQLAQIANNRLLAAPKTDDAVVRDSSADFPKYSHPDD